MLKVNLGQGDRTARIILSIGLIVGGFFAGGTAGLILGIVGLVPLITGLMGYCPLYSLFHKSTLKKNRV